MVGALSRNVLGTEAVLENLGAIGVLPPDHRSAGTAGKSSGGDTRNAGERLAQGGAEALEKIGSVDDVDGDGELIAIVLEGVSGDDDRFGHAVDFVCVLMGVIAAVGGGGDRRGEEDRENEGRAPGTLARQAGRDTH